jgi:hypothetical protein
MSGRATTSGLGLSLNSDTDGVSTLRRSMAGHAQLQARLAASWGQRQWAGTPSPSDQLAPSFAPFSTPTFSRRAVGNPAFRMAGEQGPPRNSIWPRHEGCPLLQGPFRQGIFWPSGQVWLRARFQWLFLWFRSKPSANS